MPPVREASTKPSAATVLPAPVACSNQKRLAALGSSGASATWSSSPGWGSDQSSGSSSGSSSTSSSGRSSSPGIAAEASTSGSSPPAPLARPLPLAARWDSANSAVSVPESASTWWAESTVPSTSAGSSCDSRRSRPSSSDQRRRHLVDGTSRPSASSESAQSSAARRGVPGASATAASSPSSRNGSRVNEAARSSSSDDGRDATARVAVSGSAMKARQIDVSGSRVSHPRLRAPGPQWGGVVWIACPGSTPYSSRVRRRPRRICHRMSQMRRIAAILGGLVLVALLAIGLTQAGRGDGGASSKRPFDLAKAQRELAGAPAPLAGLHRESARLLGGGRPAFERRLARLKGYPVVVNKWASWCGPCRYEFPFFQEQAKRSGKRIAFMGVDGEDGKEQARKFLRKYPVPYPSFFDSNG